MKTAGIIIGAIVISAVVTYVSASVVRTKTVDACHTYDEAGFPLSFIETLQTQPANDQCASSALSKSHPIYNVQNMVVDWAAYFIVLVAGSMAVRKKKKPGQT